MSPCPSMETVSGRGWGSAQACLGCEWDLEYGWAEARAYWLGLGCG